MWHIHDRNAACKGLVESPEKRDHLEDLGVNGIKLKWIFFNRGGRGWTGLMWLSLETSGGLE
jgi:hypothetical protein